MKMVVAAAMTVALLSGCSGDGPWDGLFGLKTGISHDQLESSVELEKVDAPDAPDNVSVYRASATPDGTVSGAEVLYAFDADSGLCGTTVIDRYHSGDQPKTYNKMVSLFGPPGKKSQRNYIYPRNTSGLDEGIDHIEVRIVPPVSGIDGEFVTSIFYINANRCLI